MSNVYSDTALKGKLALITGAASGLGKAMAEALAGCGAHVIVNHLRQEALAAEVVAGLERRGLHATSLESDVSSEQSVDHLFQSVRSQFGRLDILINNAGITRAQDIFATSLQDWQEILSVNLTGSFLCCRRAMEMMKEQKGGRIINVSSVVAHRGAIYGHAHYAATKSGLLGLTRTLARTGAPLGINVNAIAPGLIGTELLYRTHGEEDVAKLAAEIPLGLGTPGDVGLAAVFLASDASRYITGAVLDVNGGTYFH